MAILVFEHSDNSGSERLGEILRDYGHRLRVVRLHDGDDVPPDLDDVDGIVSCGGPQSAYDDSIPWLSRQMDIMREAHSLQMPVIGICLGCQILAQAMGGKVEPMAGGIELGWHEVALTPIGREDPLFTGIAWKSMQMHHHRDHVAALPPGARLLASSAKCKVQAWALGLRTYGIQYHPEVGAPTIERWAIDEPDAIREAGTTVEQLREQTKRNYPGFARLADRLFESIAFFLMPVDRRYAGVAKDLHH